MSFICMKFSLVRHKLDRKYTLLEKPYNFYKEKHQEMLFFYWFLCSFYFLFLRALHKNNILNMQKTKRKEKTD